MIYRKKQKDYFHRQQLLQENFKKELLQAQLETQESTFNSLSQELHDNIGQVLSLAKLNMSLVEINADSKLLDNIKQTKELLNNAINDIRDISKTLNTDYIKQKDIAQLVDQELAMLRRTRKFEAVLKTHGNAFSITPDRLLILFRMIQECLNNIVKHAQATAIEVTLNYSDQDFTITIADNGHGFNTAETANGIGLSNIRSRSKMIDSQVAINSTIDKGTTISIIMNKWALALN